MLDDWLRLLSVPAWLLCVGVLAPAVWRLVRRRPRYLDALFVVIFLLALNRLGFTFRLPAEVNRAIAIGLALVLACLTRSYQRADRG